MAGFKLDVKIMFLWSFVRPYKLQWVSNHDSLKFPIPTSSVANNVITVLCVSRYIVTGRTYYFHITYGRGCNARFGRDVVSQVLTTLLLGFTYWDSSACRRLCQSTYSASRLKLASSKCICLLLSISTSQSSYHKIRSLAGSRLKYLLDSMPEIYLL